MVIESINSDTNYQARQVQSIQSEKPTAENKDGTVAENFVQPSLPGTAGYQAEEPQEQQSANEKLKKAVEVFNKKVSNSEVQFGVHEETDRITIKIIDKDSKEVLKELPPEKTLDMIAKAWELAGILVDEKR